ncbi:restriction endonuclease subunit S [Mycoplasma zalophi]|uniref:Restriction endonuclease subunit S n=1 Tax=Mycoplasma zalophi TaxID=191287 RepID=A0ABS6DNT5_9MOLU|nr:restriction endonuclease subunit S [Mycoplasma zalophi]MBU4691984.1 restriction endonuclease subunit S [Mycoplasma zalophi]
MSKKLVPAIRFKEFTNDWFQDKVENIIYSAKSGGTPDTSNTEYYQGDIPFLNISDITNSDKYLYKTQKFISKSGLKNSSSMVILKNNLILALYASFGKVCINKIDLAISQAVISLEFLNSINTEFAYYIFYNMHLNHEWNKFIFLGTQPNLTSRAIKNKNIIITNINEQQKISKIFIGIDNSISLLKRKLEKLENIKNTLLNKMFANEKNLKPDIRFKEFTNDWFQEKVGNLFKVTRGQVLNTNKLKEFPSEKYKYPVFSSRTINKGLLGYYNEYLFEDAITWTTDGAEAGTVNYRKGKFYPTNVCGVLINYELANYAISYSLNDLTYKFVSKAAIPKLMNNVMANIDFYLSTDSLEMQKISKFIELFNDNISLLKRKIEKMENIKQTLLNKMFVQ